MSKKQWVMGLLMFVICAMPAFAENPLKSGEKVHVWVKGESDLTVDRVVEADGSIAFPLLGSVGVAGMTPREAAKVLARMLDDGFLRNPVVQLDRIGAPSSAPAEKAKPQPLNLQSANEPFDYPTVSAAPLIQEKKNIRVDLVDAKSGAPIANAALLIGGKIYQSNRKGQIVLESDQGQVVLLADGYRAIQNSFEQVVQKGPVNRIAMERVAIAEEVNLKVVDAVTNAPLSDVAVKLDAMRVKTNSQGTFRIKEIVKEFGELQLSKKGYKLLRRVLDFKDPSERIIPMVRDD